MAGNIDSRGEYNRQQIKMLPILFSLNHPLKKSKSNQDKTNNVRQVRMTPKKKEVGEDKSTSKTYFKY